MKNWAAAFAIISMSSGAWTADQCPKFEPGQFYPWQTSEVMPGDEWAELHVDLDAKGRPKNCRVGKNKLKPESGYYMCRAMMAQANYEPIVKDGVAVEGTVTRNFFMAGRAHRRAEEVARKKFFKDNPQERPSCYPE